MQILRFGAIGVINTALDFIIFNFISKAFHIQVGASLGLISILGFALAMVQSYFWNRYWAFSDTGKISPMHELLRLMLVGGLGFVTLVVILAGAKFELSPLFYLITLALFLGLELILWLTFSLKQTADQHATHFLSFTIVSLVGLIINAAIVTLASKFLDSGQAGANADLLKNVAKIMATVISLVWNFIGYKIFVFKK